MKFWKIIACCLAVGLGVVRAADEATPPAGFSWEKLPEIKAVLLRPEGWFFTKASRMGTLGYFISKEKIEGQGRFSTGLTINCVPNAAAKSGGKASEAVERFAADAAEKYTLLDRKGGTRGPLHSARFRYVIPAEGKEPGVTVYNLVVGNDATGTLYIVIFEAPTAEWNASFAKFGEPMLARVMLDPEF